MKCTIQTENSNPIKNETENSKDEQILEIKTNCNSSKTNKTRIEEIYFIIFHLSNQKENSNDFVFSKENDILPTIILNKEIKISDNRFAYRKVFKINNVREKSGAEIIFFIGEEDKYIIIIEIKEKTFIFDFELKIGHRILKSVALVNINQQKIE